MSTTMQMNVKLEWKGRLLSSGSGQQKAAWGEFSLIFILGEFSYSQTQKTGN